MKFLLEKNRKELAVTRIRETLREFEKNQHLFRLVFDKEKQEYSLRSIASTSYTIYDNRFCLFLLLTGLERLHFKNKITYSVGRVRYDESSFIVTLEENKNEIVGDYKIRFELVAKNSEIKDETFKINLKYTIIKNENRIFSGVSDNIVNIKHSTSIENVIRNIDKIEKIDESKKSTLHFIKDLDKLNDYTQVALSEICSKLISSNDFSEKEIKQKIRKFKENIFIEGHYKIMEGLKRLNKVVQDSPIDDQILFEQIMHKELVRIFKAKK